MFNFIKYLIILFYVLVTSSSLYTIKTVVAPIRCFNNIYLDKLLDNLRIEESDNGKKLINKNYKNKKLISIDEGPYQHNNRYQIYFANTYNCGRRYNQFDEEISRNISRQIIIKNYQITNSYFYSLITYNCGINNWKMNKIPYKSILFALKILKKTNNN